MAYARFIDSDVYVFASAYGPLECCGCSLGGEWDFWTTAEMLAHLDKHRAAGPSVPDDCIEALKAEAAENDKRAADIQAGMCFSCDGTGECRDFIPHDPKAHCAICNGTKRCSQCGGQGGNAPWAARAAGGGPERGTR